MEFGIFEPIRQLPNDYTSIEEGNTARCIGAGLAPSFDIRLRTGRGTDEVPRC